MSSSSRPSIILTRRWPQAVEEKLAVHFNANFNTEDTAFNSDQLRDALCNYDAVLPTVTDKLDESVFAALQPGDIKTTIIANYGVGYSHIDMDHTRRLGITVTNTPDVLSACTSDIAIMLMLMVARRAGEGERELRARQWTGWRPTHLVGSRVTGKTLGIVGFGRIGRETAQRAAGFDMSIRVYNRSAVDPDILQQYNAVQDVSLQALVQHSDFVSLHCPGGAENRHLINADVLSHMRPDAFLINTARGEVVDEAALITALNAGTIAGAALDVFDGEPELNAHWYGVKNAVLLPHLGSATDSTRNEMGYRALQNLLSFFDKKTPPDQVA